MSEPDPVKDEPVAREPLFRAPKVVLIVIAILVAVHVAIQLGGQNWQIWSLYAFSFIPARVSGAAPFPGIWGSQAWSFVTYGFLHADMMHLFFNSLWFLVFGSVVARRLGAFRFLVLTCVSTIAGACSRLEHAPRNSACAVTPTARMKDLIPPSVSIHQSPSPV